MNSVRMECKNCEKIVDCEIIEMHEGEHCWMVFVFKCPECGNVMEIKMNC